MKHLISLAELTKDAVEDILSLSDTLKNQWREGKRSPLLAGRVLTMVFEKPSLRTRNSFEAAAIQLGAGSIFLTGQDAGLNGRESLEDVARVLSSYSDVVVLRTFSQKLIEDFAAVSRCPVINGLSDDLHPCQALTDVMTIRESLGDLQGRHLVYVGDGNNMAASLAMIGAMLEMPVTVCTPDDFALPTAFVSNLRERFPQAEINISTDPAAAVKHADVVYTDVWASMGQEAEKEHRNKVFAPYQINDALMAHAPSDCRFMHCLPARRGTEVTDSVIDGPRSIAFPQAENRMHLSKGLLVWLLDLQP